MGPLLAAYIYIIACIGAGAVLCCFAFGRNAVIKISVLWVGVITLAFFTHIMVLFVAVAMYAAYIKHQPHESKAFLYVALMPILPLETYVVPFPGLNYLIGLSFLRIFAIAFFLPLFFQALSKPSREGGVRSTDVYFFCFILLMALMSFRSGNVTSTMRSIVDVMLDFGIPYYVITRYVTKSEFLSWVFCGFLISAAFLSFCAIIESIKVWRFYAQVLFSLNLQFDPSAVVPYSRNGVVRTGGGPMFQTLAFAYFIAMAIVMCFFFWKKGIIRLIPAGILMTLYSCALMYTDSKGGMMAVVVGVLVIYYVDLHKSFKFMATVAGIIIVPIMIGYLFSSDLSKADDGDGSFSYRYQLFLNSLDAISRNPILGSPDFTDNKVLQGSIQGEGIIDVVNLYLLVTLEYGFVGLFLYLMIFLSLIKGIVRKENVAGFDHKGLVLGLIAMTMVLILTISDASFVPFYIMLVWALARTYIGLEENRFDANGKVQYSN